ncbi:HU family DNA-binding protein [Marinomonas sp. 2405UD68-3]|uniref:HU family DNA-binding protein n=1 Tax=Marinomonas sp. 2405UD68-3 TaxID=3391835 RepID=UPI0039C9A81E
MIKKDLIASISEHADIPKAIAAAALDATLTSIEQALADGDQVTLVGFGTFSVKERSARTGRNPQTGEDIQIKASKLPTFKAGAMLKKTVNEIT